VPIPLTYPGIYLEEVPSGARTIVGVPTSIAAFIGRALRGPVEKPVSISRFADYEQIFGGLDLDSPMSFAVRDFYLNGGRDAVIVRLFRPSEKRGNANDKNWFEIQPAIHPGQNAATLRLKPAWPGRWGVNVRVVLDTDIAPLAKTPTAENPPPFNLLVRDDTPGGATEYIRNLSIQAGSARLLDRVLLSESSLLRCQGSLAETITGDVPTALVNLYQATQTLRKATGKDRGPLAKDLEELKFKDAITRAQDNLAARKQDVPPNPAAITNAENALRTEQEARAKTVDDGTALQASDFKLDTGESEQTGLYSLDKTDLFNLLCIPPFLPSKADPQQFDVDPNVRSSAAAYCARRRAVLLVDAPASWHTKGGFQTLKNDPAGTLSSDIGINGPEARNAAIYFPRLQYPNPLRGNKVETFASCGAIAGVCARIDTARGVWKAPAGLEATLVGAQRLAYPLTDSENGLLNQVGINCLRAFPVVGRIVWGARTLRGADALGDEYQHVPVRRLALFLEESLYRGTQWAVFEPNDEPLWASLRLAIGAFLQDLFRQGAFQGKTPREGYFVKCDKDTTTQSDINRGIVNVVVGFAPLKPAEFVVIRIQQLAGQLQI
jgi:phage tail sheath protein FI